MKLILIFISVFLISLQCNSQILKIRLELGGNLGFSSFGEGVVTKYYERPLNNPYFSLNNRITTIKDIGPQFSIMLEYVIIERFHIESGFLFRENAMMS